MNSSKDCRTDRSWEWLKQYLSFVSLEYRICDDCEVELDCYHRFGKHFSYRTINNKNYPTIPYGSGMEYLCVPYLNLHSHFQLLIIVVSAAIEIATNYDRRRIFVIFMLWKDDCGNETLEFIAPNEDVSAGVSIWPFIPIRYTLIQFQ